MNELYHTKVYSRTDLKVYDLYGYYDEKIRAFLNDHGVSFKLSGDYMENVFDLIIEDKDEYIIKEINSNLRVDFKRDNIRHCIDKVKSLI